MQDDSPIRAHMDPRYDPAIGPVVPIFIRYAVPSVLGMLAATSAGIIDGFFIGNYVGATALAAVNIAQPAWAVFAAHCVHAGRGRLGDVRALPGRRRPAGRIGHLSPAPCWPR